jgi:hypothetical protein
VRKIVLFVVVICFLVAASMAYAGAAFGPKDFPKGKLCCVNDVCVMAKSAEDCAKIGGTVVKSCKECGKEQAAKGGSKETPAK